MTNETEKFTIDWGLNEDTEPRADDVRLIEAGRTFEAPLPVDSPPGAETTEVQAPWQPSREPEAFTPHEETFDAADFEESHDEPFDRPGTDKVGIVGGKGTGKSYLFQAMVYRTFAGRHSGALTWYLERDAMQLFMAKEQPDGRGGIKTGTARAMNRVSFIKKYQNWQRLPFTMKEEQHWYRLRLPYRTGWLGGVRSALDVEFFDGSGEGFFGAGSVTSADRALWERNYAAASVMVFCLPLWAAFPDSSISDHDAEWRDMMLEDFEQVVQNYSAIRRDRPVSSIVALTMSDDRRGALRTLRDRWISPFIDSPHTYLKQLRKGSGVARYLANARLVSEALHEEFESSGDPRVSNIPQRLDFGRGKPWIVALSAMEGVRLDELELKYENPDDAARAREARSAAPTPVHVELPLLLALCERENALM
ncbi:MAG: hypothetical protein M3Q69_17125 [Acidobacteriota bacterium]|nr:hypothetical protein [Acidobacteriota bacterium]